MPISDRTRSEASWIDSISSADSTSVGPYRMRGWANGRCMRQAAALVTGPPAAAPALQPLAGRRVHVRHGWCPSVTG